MPTNVLSKDDFDFDLVSDAASELDKLCQELNATFPEREFLIEQLRLALLMRTNVLIYGIYGSAKSLLIRMFMDGVGVPEDELFAIEMTRYTTEADLFGPINVPKLRDEGVQTRNPEGTILDAKMADLGEVFDAPHLLRSLHGPLYERWYRRGADATQLPLHTVVASTNLAPGELKKQYPHLDAAVDRFIFQTQVGWLNTEGSTLQMLRNFREGAKPMTRLGFEGIHTAAALVSAPTDQISDELIVVFDRVQNTLRSGIAKDRKVSDRAICQWLEVLEANAVAHGRYEVVPEDLKALRYVVCDGSNATSLAQFDELIEPIITETTAQFGSMSHDEALLMLMDSIRNSLPITLPAPDDTAQLVDTLRFLREKRTELSAMLPELESNRVTRDELIDQIDQRIEGTEALIRG